MFHYNCYGTYTCGKRVNIVEIYIIKIVRAVAHRTLLISDRTLRPEFLQANNLQHNEDWNELLGGAFYFNGEYYVQNIGGVLRKWTVLFLKFLQVAGPF